jgi:hypothetical protein
MMTLTKKNHVRFKRLKSFSVSFGRCSRQPFDWRTECLIAAREIQEVAGKRPIAIPMSGGLDSELVAECFRLARIPFEAFSLEFPKNKNRHDIQWAIDYCKKYSIRHHMYPFDPMEFYQSGELEAMIKIYKGHWPLLFPTMRLASELDRRGYFSVLGCFDTFLTGDKPDWTLPFYAPEFVLFEYFKKNKIHGTPAFFIWSPEQLYAYITSLPMQKQMEEGLYSITDDFAARKDIYLHYFDLKPRLKYDGYENFSDFGRFVLDLARESLPPQKKTIYMPIKTLQRKLLPHANR